MAVDLRALLGVDGVARIADLAALTSPASVTRWQVRGRLVRLLPHVVALPEEATRWRTRARAAVLSTGGALSHASALAVWDLAPQPAGVQVVIEAARRAPVPVDWLTVHRVASPARPLVRAGLPVTPLARSVIDAWGDAHRRRGAVSARRVARAATISAVRRYRPNLRALLSEIAGHPRLPGRTALFDLLGYLLSGAQSELEIWGMEHVLDVPGIPACRQQFAVHLPQGRFALDAAWPEVRLAVELDGAAFHGSAEARERDLRRDAALAAAGWLVLRFSYRRLMREPEACRAEIAAAYRARLTVAQAVR